MEPLNYAVIGGGIGGIAAARQLCAMNPSARIAIFESTREVGGRLRSKMLAGDADVVELGGTRFNPRLHRRVNELVTETGLKTKPFSYDFAPIQNGLHQHAKELLASICGELRDIHDGLDANDRQRLSFTQAALPALGESRLACLIDLAGYDVTSHPSIPFEVGYGFLSHVPETSALFGQPAQDWRCLTDGFQALPRAMHASLPGNCSTEFDHRLVEIAAVQGRSGYRLTLESPESTRVVLAEKVLMAMPMQSLGSISGVPLAAAVRDRIKPVPLIKAYFEYSERWWTKLGLEGRCFSTASAFRKIYFPDHGRHLWVYCDSQSASRLRDAFADRNEVCEAFSETLADVLPFAAQDIPAPSGQGFAYWPEGIAFWDSGLNMLPGPFWSVGKDFCVCSDLFTADLGWVEGAVASAERAATFLARGSMRTCKAGVSAAAC
ncbi:flavin monoamine oxidase family protein [Mesorhizobium neociceri]|uniref:FAD-dependent oxidoreductase n=1 Tax=Mesorhizobium neociceri TaxID=1307853 RepID=A0A838BB75_9HYPH|nr:FAD-dependent oxidoreductase [Mesorhizobium neociceri]MBA1143269.1 FAD-dependent oxidoreductase [Mesorhizobium neociceri]